MKKMKKVLGVFAVAAAATGALSLASCDSKEVKVESIKEVDYGVMPASNPGIALAATTYTRNELITYCNQYISNNSYSHSNIATTIGDDEYDGYYESFCDDYEFDWDYNVFSMIKNGFLDIKEFTQSGRIYGSSDLSNQYITFKENYIYLIGAESYPTLVKNLAWDDTTTYIFNECLFNGESGVNGYIYENYFTKAYDYLGSSSNDIAIVIPNCDITLKTSIYNECYICEYAPVDKISPDFNVSSYYIPVNVDNPLTHAQIISQIGATDETDGDVTSSVKLVSTTYSPTNLVLGNHTFEVSAQDAAGNVAYATFTVNVYDLTKPTITGTSSYSISYSDTLTLDTIKSALTLSDNFDSTLTLNTISDGYSGNEGKVGTYTIKFNTADDSGNTSDTFTVTVTITDSKAPVITGSSTIEVATSKQLTLAELKAKITVNDEYDGVLTDYTVSNFENYQNNYKVVGSYPVTITATDSSGNSSTFTITIKTNDAFAPEFWVYSDFVIQLPVGTELTADMIISYLAQIGEVNAAEVVSVSYECDTTTPGTYDVKIVKMNGSVYTTSISVVDLNSNGTTNNSTKSNWWTNLWNILSGWFGNFWDWIVDLFNGNDKAEVDTETVEPESTPEETPSTDATTPAVMSDIEIIDDQFVVYECEPVDPDAGVPATMPEEDLESTPAV